MELPEKLIKEIADQISSGMRCFINKTNNEIIILPTDEYMFDLEEEEEKENLEKINSNEDDYLEIEPPSSRRGFEMMESFLDKVTDENFRSEIIHALEKKGPFRRFKDLVEGDADWAPIWYKHRDDEYINYVKECIGKSID